LIDLRIWIILIDFVDDHSSNLINRSRMRRLMMLVRFTNISMIIPENERYWTWLTIQVRIVNDIACRCRYRQSHKTWLAIPEVKANDVKNLDIDISENISRYYGKKNLIGYFGLEIVNDINRRQWCWHLQRTWLVGHDMDD
jgi:hypothetical protein